jgi:hypothetical protein
VSQLVGLPEIPTLCAYGLKFVIPARHPGNVVIPEVFSPGPGSGPESSTAAGLWPVLTQGPDFEVRQESKFLALSWRNFLSQSVATEPLEASRNDGLCVPN